MAEPRAASSGAAGVRAANRAAVEARLVEVGLRHVAAHGGAGLSLRAVARDLDLVPSALYRYVASRDELLTVLIVHAFTSLSDAVEAAHARVPAMELAARWAAVAHAIRDWALSHRQEFALIFGTPVPGYHAPASRTTAPATRVLLLLARVGADADARGLPVSDQGERAGRFAAAAAEYVLTEAGIAVSPSRTIAGLAAWNAVVGAILAELFDYFGEQAVDADGYFGYVVAITTENLGLRG